MLGSVHLRRLGALAAAGLLALSVAACSDFGSMPKEFRPLDAKTKKLIEKKGMQDTSPIMIRLFKEDSVLEVWKKQRATSKYALLKTYDICAWSGALGPKKVEGDRQAPEGFYTITPAQLNPKSAYHLSFNIGYPNAYDQSLGRTGSQLMVHGACSSRGCYSMNDENIQEIYTLARFAFQGGQRDFQVQAYPFRMTAENMAKHRRDPNMEFWRMLKEGYDHFEVIRQPPKVDVCSQRYVFNSVPQDGVAFSATAQCPPMTVPDQIRVAVADKEAKDEQQFAMLSAKLDAKELDDRKTDGVANPPPVMLAAAPAAAPMSLAEAPVSLEPATTASLAPQPAAGPPPPAEVATAYAPEPPQRKGVGGWIKGLFN